MISVTKPFLPPKEEYLKLLDGIWEREWLTNMGPLATQLESDLKLYLGVSNLNFVTNGTIALQMAIKALELTGEVITTPFSFVATSSSIVWENCTPIFVDIDSETLNIDPDKIEAKITKKTSAILATHVYGNPCDVETIEAIARKHNLKIIYDGAHAFGVELSGKSIFEYGDVSICSLHATKLYHSVEGGLIICQKKNLDEKLKYMRNFGISGFETFAELGINGKNSEFHAAMGIANLKYVEMIRLKRKELAECYDKNLSGFGSTVKWNDKATRNFAYYPLVLDNENQLLNVKMELERNEIHTRRYFYPSLASALPYIQATKMPVTDEIAKRVLCLPLYYELKTTEVEMISKLILKHTK